jgi:carbon-monoxide dehydrogenase large subunit
MSDSPSSVRFKALRREDARLLTGRGRFTADIRPTDAAHVAFVRSQHARGRLIQVDTSAAACVPGVIAVFTARDLGPLCVPPINPLLPLERAESFDLLANERISWSGQPVAIVVAESRAAARAAADQVVPEVDPEQAVTDFGVESDPVVRVQHRLVPGNAEPAAAAVRVKVALESPRLVAMALEPRAVTVQVDAAAPSLTVWLASQAPSRARDDIARTLGLPVAQVRVITPDVGGAFGARASVVPEDLLVPWAAWRLRRSLRWVASRSEEFMAGMHGRGSQMRGQLDVAADGGLLDLTAQLRFALGAWMPFSSVVPLRNAARILPGPYHVQSLSIDGEAALSNTAAVNIYRGAGRPEAVLLSEVLIERAARALQIDPVDLRRRNLIESHELPYRTPTGETLDSGDYRALLERACERFGYASARKEQAVRRARGQCVGIGVALYVEPCGQGWESARVTLHPNGRVTVASGSPAQGQGHQTGFARIAAEALGCDDSLIDVVLGDTALCPDGVGALASRSTAIGGSAIVEACTQVLALRAEGQALPIIVDARFNAREAWASGCVVAQVCIDEDSGQLVIERVVWIDDAGRVVHPALVHGQLLGGFAQGMGQALMERVVYDEHGQLLTGSLMDYAVPRADDLPELMTESLSQPTSFNLLGAKGVGEAGCIGVPAALMNAARDALAPWGEADLQFPLTAPRVWQAMATLRETLRPESRP